VYQPGQRIELLSTTDPHTELRPGDKGTVRSYNIRLDQLEVDWDSGSRLSMLLSNGDAVALLN
jgi:hypothetical protein